MTETERIRKYIQNMPSNISINLNEIKQLNFFDAPASRSYHGAKSVIIAQKYIKLTDEEIACIRWRMGAYERDPKMWDYYGRAVEKYHNVLWTHAADMLASKILGV